ncbi:MAG: hypothetical protein M1830_001104, partial [Pleopsidium flavum]
MASETPSVSAQSTSSALKTSETELRGALQGITLLGEVAVEFRGHLSHPPADHEAVPTIQEWQGLNQQVQGWYGNASTLLTGWEQRESISTAALQKTQSDVESLRKSLQDERNAMAAERARLADERDAVTAEAHSDVESLRKSLQNERDAVAAERTKLANERDAVAAERAKLTEEYKKVLASGGQLVDSMNAAKSAERSYRKKGTQILWGLNEVQRKRVEWLETFKQGLNVELSKVQE